MSDANTRFTVRERASSEVLATGLPGSDVILLEGNWYFAPDTVTHDKLVKTERTYRCPYKGLCYWIDVETPTGRAQNVAWVYDNPLPGYEHIAGRVAFYGRDTTNTLAQQEALQP